LLLGRKDVAADSVDREGRTPLSYAAELGHEAIVKMLLECIRNVGVDYITLHSTT
jgi:hypothetical protein